MEFSHIFRCFFDQVRVLNKYINQQLTKQKRQNHFHNPDKSVLKEASVLSETVPTFVACRCR